jgi:hypothetical protein
MGSLDIVRKHSNPVQDRPLHVQALQLIKLLQQVLYEESVVDKFKSNLLLMIIWLNIINYNS